MFLARVKYERKKLIVYKKKIQLLRKCHSSRKGQILRKEIQKISSRNKILF